MLVHLPELLDGLMNMLSDPNRWGISCAAQGPSELVNLVPAPPSAWLPGAWLPGAWLPGAWLPGAWLPGAWLPVAWLAVAWLPGAWLPGAWLPGAWLAVAWLPGAELPRADAIAPPGACLLPGRSAWRRTRR
jgi:hypothetical protein